MSKRLKRRIYELCGLNNLKREDKLRRATEILHSPELKQEICKNVLGLSHREVEKVLKDLLDSAARALAKMAEDDELKAKTVYDNEPETPLSRRQPTKIGMLLDEDRVNALLKASKMPYVPPKESGEQNVDHPTYTPEQVAQLLAQK